MSHIFFINVFNLPIKFNEIKIFNKNNIKLILFNFFTLIIFTMSVIYFHKFKKKLEKLFKNYH